VRGRVVPTGDLAVRAVDGGAANRHCVMSGDVLRGLPIGLALAAGQPLSALPITMGGNSGKSLRAGIPQWPNSALKLTVTLRRAFGAPSVPAA
jgi:hypothetical protein